MTGVSDGDVLNPATADLCQKRSQPFSQHDVGLHLNVFVVRDRRHIHGILNYAMLQIFLDLHRDLLPDRFLRFIG